MMDWRSACWGCSECVLHIVLGYFLAVNSDDSSTQSLYADLHIIIGIQYVIESTCLGHTFYKYHQSRWRVKTGFYLFPYP